MFYIVEHDMGVHQIIDNNGKANKYGKAKLFNTENDALHWLVRHKKGMTATWPYYEVKEATQEDIERWR